MQVLDVRIEYYVLVCYKEAGAALYWRIFLFAYLAVLQILGIMLAFQTRKVKVKSLRDSTFVTANVYIIKYCDSHLHFDHFCPPHLHKCLQWDTCIGNTRPNNNFSCTDICSQGMLYTTITYIYLSSRMDSLKSMHTNTHDVCINEL